MLGLQLCARDSPSQPMLHKYLLAYIWEVCRMYEAKPWSVFGVDQSHFIIIQ